MVIDNSLRQRILRSLRWLVRDAQWRFNQVKDDLDSGSQGYSPELKEAMDLLEDLKQNTFFCGSEEPHILGWSEQQCIDEALRIGLPEETAKEFYVKYRPQGWLWGNGLPITDLTTALRRFKMYKQKDTPEAVKNKSGKTPRQRYYEDLEAKP
jgi:hypothetical protein